MNTMNSTQARAAIEAAQSEITKLASHADELQAAWQAAAQAGDDSRCDEIEALQATLRRKQTRQEYLLNEATNALAAAEAAEEVARREATRAAGVAAFKAAGKHSQTVEALLSKLGDALASYQAAIGEAAQAARTVSGNGFISGIDSFRCASLALQHQGDNRRRLAEGLNIDTRDFAHFTADTVSIANALENAQ